MRYLDEATWRPSDAAETSMVRWPSSACFVAAPVEIRLCTLGLGHGGSHSFERGASSDWRPGDDAPNGYLWPTRTDPRMVVQYPATLRYLDGV